MKKFKSFLNAINNININDTQNGANQGATFTRQLKNMLHLARVITIGALNRDESRGAHYKPDFPERNDEQFYENNNGEIRWPKSVHQSSIMKKLMYL